MTKRIRVVRQTDTTKIESEKPVSALRKPALFSVLRKMMIDFTLAISTSFMLTLSVHRPLCPPTGRKEIISFFHLTNKDVMEQIREFNGIGLQN